MAGRHKQRQRKAVARAGTVPAAPAAAWPIDQETAANLVLLLVAAVIAYVIPFELLLLSYAVLGPAHYLSQISWLHERKYFLPRGGIIVALFIVAAGVLAMRAANAAVLGLLLGLLFAVCAIAAMAPTARLRIVGVAAPFLLGCAMLVWPYAFAVFAVLLPTVIHVSVFTFVFMLLGVIKSGRPANSVLPIAYVAIVVFIMIVPPNASAVMPGFAAIADRYFGEIGEAIGLILGGPKIELAGRLIGFLGFAYAFHYINWFAKTRTIGWTDVKPWRLAIIIGGSVMATGLYFYDYHLGIFVLLTLAIAHVVLEFPLDARAIGDLSRIIGSALVGRASRGYGRAGNDR